VLRAPATRLVVADPALVGGWRAACHLHNPQYRPAGPPDELAGVAQDRPEPDDPGAPAVDSPVAAESLGGEQ